MLRFQLEMRLSAYSAHHQAQFDVSSQADVIPEVVMAKVNSASGSKYSISKETPRRYEPIAPLGTAYSPVGKIDIAELRKNSPRDVPQPAVSLPRRYKTHLITNISARISICTRTTRAARHTVCLRQVCEFSDAGGQITPKS